MRHWHFDVDSTAHFKVDLVGSFEKFVKNRRLTGKIWKKINVDHVTCDLWICQISKLRYWYCGSSHLFLWWPLTRALMGVSSQVDAPVSLQFVRDFFWKIRQTGTLKFSLCGIFVKKISIIFGEVLVEWNDPPSHGPTSTFRLLMH